MLSVVMRCRASLERAGQAKLPTDVSATDLCKEEPRVRFQVREQNFRALRWNEILSSSPYSFPIIPSHLVSA